MAPIDRLIVLAPPDARAAADLVNSLRAEADKAGADHASLLREAAGRIRSLTDWTRNLRASFRKVDAEVARLRRCDEALSILGFNDEVCQTDDPVAYAKSLLAAPSVPAATSDPFAGALRLLEGATAYTGFVVAAQTQAGGTAVAARNTTAKLRARVDEQMALQDSGVTRDDDEDRPHTAVAQLRELANWLRAQGESTKADDADELAEAIAFKYEVV
jgi:hypothetical protein